MTRYALALVGVCLFMGPAAADPPKVDRTIGKEPVYQTKSPKYGLLMFGPEGKDRVWLVLDGDTLYVDRKGNGDLTEPGNKVLAEKKPRHAPQEYGYRFDVGEVKVGGRTHKGLGVSFTPLRLYADDSFGKRPEVKAALAKDPKAMSGSVWVDAELAGMKGGGLSGRVSFFAGPFDLTGVLQFGNTPAHAPVVHIGGPLQVTFYAERPTLRVGRASEFVLVVGIPGDGPGTFASLGYTDTIPVSAKPVAEVTFASARPGAPPFKEKFEIKDRC